MDEEDLWKTLDKGPTLQEQESKVQELTEALIHCSKENLKMAHQLIVERHNFNLVVMETRKLRFEVLDWRMVVEILLAEIKYLFSRAPVKMNQEPALTTITRDEEDTLSGSEGNYEVEHETSNKMSIDDSFTVDNYENLNRITEEKLTQTTSTSTGHSVGVPASTSSSSQVIEDPQWMDTNDAIISDVESLSAEELKIVKNTPVPKKKVSPDKMISVKKTSVPKKKVKTQERKSKRIAVSADKTKIVKNTQGNKKKLTVADSFDKSVNGYHCKICKKVIPAKPYLSAHLRSHNQEPILHTCEFCDSVFREKWKLAMHVKHLHLQVPEKVDLCDLCGKSFSTNANMRRHRQCHFEARPFLCDICGKGFKTQGILKQHNETHLGKQQKLLLKLKNNRYTCKECGLVITEVTELAEHLKIHPRKITRKCKVCGVRFDSMTLLARHLKTHPDLPRYQCEHCDKDFASKLALMNHQDVHSTEMQFSCEICKKSFSKRGSYYFHKKWYHKKCEQCGEMLTNDYALQEHSYIHTGIPPFECPACSMKFTNRRLFWKHKLTHDELKPFVCHCGSRFVNAVHLTGHQKLHAKLGPVIVPRGNQSSTTFVKKKKSNGGKQGHILERQPSLS